MFGFTREISGTAELHVVNRGSVEEIDVVPGHECNNKLAATSFDLCPVGALCSKDFLYKKRVLVVEECLECLRRVFHWLQHSFGSEREQALSNATTQQSSGASEFICDEGRFGWKYVHSESRLTRPIWDAGWAEPLTTLQTADFGCRFGWVACTNGKSGVAVLEDQLNFQDPWKQVLESARNEIRRVAKEHEDRFAFLFSPFMTCEEAFLLRVGSNRSTSECSWSLVRSQFKVKTIFIPSRTMDPLRRQIEFASPYEARNVRTDVESRKSCGISNPTFSVSMSGLNDWSKGNGKLPSWWLAIPSLGYRLRNARR